MTGTLPWGGGIPWTPPAGLERQGVTPKPVSSPGPQEGVVAATSGEIDIAVANDAPHVGPPSVGLVSEGPYPDAPVVSRVPGPFKPGDMLNGYRIIKEIGYGGYARVYKAHDELIDTCFAIKVIFRPSANAKELDRRTKAEARFLWSVEHPYVVRVYTAGFTEAKSLYFVMQLLEGRSLRSILLKRGKLRWQDAVPLFAKIAEGVHAAHARSVIHRDLKPENIFVLKDGTPKVLDFGIAKFVDAPPLTTREHVFHGTPPYMSPEQLSGRQVTYQSDVYALGIVLWEVLAGRHPMVSADGDNDPNSVAYRHIYSHPPLVSEIEASVGKPIARLVNRMISKVPSQRPASMPEVAKELMRCYEKCSFARRGFFGAITTGRVHVKAATELNASQARPWFDDGIPAAADQAPVAVSASREPVAPSAIEQQRPLDAHAPSREQAPSEPATRREPARDAANAADAAAEHLKLRVGFTREFSSKLLSQLRLRPSIAVERNADPELPNTARSNTARSNTARPRNPESAVVPARESKSRSLVLQLLVLAVGGLALGGAFTVSAMHLLYGRARPEATVRAATVNALPSAHVAATQERVDSPHERADSSQALSAQPRAAAHLPSSVQPTGVPAAATSAASVTTAMVPVGARPASVASGAASVAPRVTPSVTAPAARAVAKVKPKASNADRFLKALEAELAQRKVAKAAAKQQLPSVDKLLFTPQPEPKAGAGRRASKQNSRPTIHVGTP